jgi:hypothetical protein
MRKKLITNKHYYFLHQIGHEVKSQKKNVQNIGN